MPVPPTDPAEAGVTEQAGTFTYHDRTPTLATARVRVRDRRARVVRAVKTLAAGWGLAVAAVFLPVLHFVLVPALLIGGPVFALMRLGEARSLLTAAGACPACGAGQSFTLREAWRERTPLRCEACGRAIELRLPPAPR